MPALTSVTDLLLITDNDCLSRAEAEAFAAGDSVNAYCYVSDNGANHPCN